MPSHISYIVGLDLGQSINPAALVVVEKSSLARLPVYVVCHIERYPLGTDYCQYVAGRPGIVEMVRGLLQRPPLPNCTLGVDETGVGRAVMDLFRAAALPCWLRPVTSTSGFDPKLMGDGSIHVPKKDLVAAVNIVLQSRRLAITELPPRDPPVGQSGPYRGELSKQLAKELQAYRVSLTKSKKPTETFAAESGAYDDLVSALAIAIWLGERGTGATTDLRSGGTQSGYAPDTKAPDSFERTNSKPGEALKGIW
jgi:hypothetical protein